MRIEPFNPCDIVRYGKDNAVYIRGINGDWYSVNIGYRGNNQPSGRAASRWDDEMYKSIRDGYAQVIYRSPGHYASEES